MINALFGNPKTTLAGLLTAIGLFLEKRPEPGYQIIGQVLMFAGPLLFGAVASDAKPAA